MSHCIEGGKGGGGGGGGETKISFQKNSQVSQDLRQYSTKWSDNVYKGVISYDISAGQHQPSSGLLKKTRIYMVFIFSMLTGNCMKLDYVMCKNYMKLIRQLRRKYSGIS